MADDRQARGSAAPHPPGDATGVVRQELLEALQELATFIETKTHAHPDVTKKARALITKAGG